VNAEGHHQRSSGLVQVGSTESVSLDLRPQRPDDPGPVNPVGIGAVLVASNDSVVVDALRPGHAAAPDGLVPGDELLEIDGHAVADLGLGGAVEAMRGAEGTSVFLQVRRGNRTLDVEVPRQRRR
jgi:C-terminal processing protease CtpA/Prc